MQPPRTTSVARSARNPFVTLRKKTALHEYGHRPGHPDRLNHATLRQGMEERFHSAAYAREELRAES